jgi:hypothetical protein
MTSTSINELKWIHDCKMQYFSVQPDSGAGQTMTLTLKCPNDLGYPLWDGKTIRLYAFDIAVLRYLALGIMAEVETIDAIREGVSRAFQETTSEARALGIKFPTTALTFVFHSGSSIEVLCKEIKVSIVDPLSSPGTETGGTDRLCLDP